MKILIDGIPGSGKTILANEIANEIPGAKLEIITGAGHLSNIEQPEIFNSKVIKFLNDL